MNPLSRRHFLAQGAAAAGAVAVAGQLIEPASAASSHAEEVAPWWPAEPVASEPFVVYIRNAAKGEVALLSGEQEIVYTDRALVSRLQRTVRRAAW